ncbi:hypothetical protein N7535_003416 [Penicillium sp. DV-2018c]|nr:hypothetical protein N7535_003416 [Penicillium sp. DV-2018c]
MDIGGQTGIHSKTNIHARGPFSSGSKILEEEFLLLKAILPTVPPTDKWQVHARLGMDAHFQIATEYLAGLQSFNDYMMWIRNWTSPTDIAEGIFWYSYEQQCQSTEAFIFFYVGAPVSWNSRKEEIADARCRTKNPEVFWQETAEMVAWLMYDEKQGHKDHRTSAEYMAFDAAVREAMWLYKIMNQRGIPQDLPITLFAYSDNAVTIMKKDNFAKATKWIDVRYHFVRHAICQGIVALQLNSSADNIAGALTKPLG